MLAITPTAERWACSADHPMPVTADDRFELALLTEGQCPFCPSFPLDDGLCPCCQSQWTMEHHADGTGSWAARPGPTCIQTA